MVSEGQHRLLFIFFERDDYDDDDHSMNLPLNLMALKTTRSKIKNQI